MPLHIATPLLASPALSAAAGREVWLKLEAAQPPGSFKIRGVGLACETHARAGKRRLLSSSGGNAGMAVAYAGQRLGLPVTVVVPHTTSAHARQAIAQYGAEVVVHGRAWDEAHALAQSLLDGHTAFIHPFDDPLLWQGHASLIDEVAAAGLRPDAVLLAVGGGGLLAGVAEGLRRHGWDGVTLIAAETAGAHAYAQALQQGQAAALPAITSLATSLGARQVCAQALAVARQQPVRSSVVSDAQAVAACLRFLDEHRILTEPACGAALAPLYAAAPVLHDCQRLLVVVCGGATCTLAQLQAWHADLHALP
ncbi:serine dehydratase [Vandammella animalimorsus]|uniref:L-serine ammonia-lyase n=1 Tax=Vandammella animalimorsus TaxID=2029117 RepID=A0A2A2ASS5_9BURK|nr:pyridoxal-phosphate dependent enzyme [Vandammella animalimorsus]PAT41630.1 serine dehydratase [Vandammella animalimorsus]